MADEMEVDAGSPLPEPRGTKRSATEAGLGVSSEAPQRIKAGLALDPDVVNKIAAGEIIVAPMHALKELLENAVDAGSTSIEVLVKDGGLKLLQITDNGHGIERDDLPILCERFTTSKLKEFDDLLSIGTYGFRGEALASISHIAHLRITTKTAGSSCAWQAHYSTGKLVPAKPGQSADPKPTAGRQGTQITVEDLFYNVPTRRKTFRSPSEEYAKILDVITRYSVHCSQVSFSVKKHGESGVGHSVAASASVLDRIRHAHGAAVAKEIFEFSTDDKRWGFKASGYSSNANYHGKRMTMLLFINHRSVESSAIKKALEQTYSMFLPKGQHPFVYLNLEIDPARVDVNVHPTKREVHFLNEDEIIDLICEDIRERLAKVDTSRTFKTQTLLPGVIPMTPLTSRVGVHADSPAGEEKTTSKTPATTKKPYENNLVRTDSKMRKITSMLPPALNTATSADDAGSRPNDGFQYDIIEREQTQIRLTSVKSLRAQVRDKMHNNLTETFASLTYVGLVDSHRRLAAIQSGVKLFLVDYGMIANEFFYQVGLTDFANFGHIKLDPAPKLRELLHIAAKLERETSPESMEELDQNLIVDSVYEQLLSRAAMLREYFSIDISTEADEAVLTSVPLLLKGYLPSLVKLPTFLLRLGPFVDWTDEEQCFHTFLTELASFYVPEQLPCSGKPKATPVGQKSQADSQANKGRHETDKHGEEAGEEIEPVEDLVVERRRLEIEFALEHVLFPAFRARLVATKGLLKGVVEVANLKGLYRVFERC